MTRQEELTINVQPRKKERNVNNQPTRKSRKRKGRIIALLLGVGIAIFTLIVQHFTDPVSTSFIKPLKYVFVFGGFYYALSQYKQVLPKNRIFRKGAVLGIIMSLYLAFSLVATLSLSALVFPAEEFTKYNKEITQFSQFITFDALLFVETFVFGIIISFICLQGLKDTNRTA